MLKFTKSLEDNSLHPSIETNRFIFPPATCHLADIHTVLKRKSLDQHLFTNTVVYSYKTPKHTSSLDKCACTWATTSLSAPGNNTALGIPDMSKKFGTFISWPIPLQSEGWYQVTETNSVLMKILPYFKVDQMEGIARQRWVVIDVYNWVGRLGWHHKILQY